MASQSFQTFEHAIKDADDLLNHFDTLNTNPPPPEIEVLKRASLVMALAALEAYFEDRLNETAEKISSKSNVDPGLAEFFRDSLANDLKFFHTPSTDRVRTIFKKYLSLDITEAWSWNNYEPAQARKELNALAKKRGDVAHRSWRPVSGEAQPTGHVVKRDDLRKHIHFVKQVAVTTDAYLEEKF